MAERAVILFAHGAREPQWARPFERLKEELSRRLPGERVALAFLELMQPSLSECAATLHAEGVRALRIVPVFFGAGGHLKHDLPAIVARLREHHPGLEIEIDPPIGEQQSVIAAIAAVVAG